jgi:hypothetical protein
LRTVRPWSAPLRCTSRNRQVKPSHASILLRVAPFQQDSSVHVHDGSMYGCPHREASRHLCRPVLTRRLNSYSHGSKSRRQHQERDYMGNDLTRKPLNTHNLAMLSGYVAGSWSMQEETTLGCEFIVVKEAIAVLKGAMPPNEVAKGYDCGCTCHYDCGCTCRGDCGCTCTSTCGCTCNNTCGWT